MLINTYDYYQKIKETKTILVYNGPVWEVSVEELGETIHKRLEFEDLSVSVAHSIFSVFVEQMTNISLYSAEKAHFHNSDGSNTEIARGIFILGTAGDRYILQCGNVIGEYSRGMLKSRIDHLNSLEKKELRRYYMEQLNGENVNPESRGAGLGLTEIAKRASSKIEYEFTPMENGETFFAMRVEMGGK